MEKSERASARGMVLKGTGIVEKARGGSSGRGRLIEGGRLALAAMEAAVGSIGVEWECWRGGGEGPEEELWPGEGFEPPEPFERVEGA